eukprot:TRINITY_DN33382_c0_g1_i1.p1 TRINITY_DN33382_c0_g1~~TRINITY_DN33382_c0_g1_i1.p1  ORF type:complete len:281 (+),score=39.46 TRINITY_DN33382_c0_g1_i1:90-932(+)
MGQLVFAAPEPSYHPLEYHGELLWVFHANAEDLGQLYVTLRYLRSYLRVHVLAVEYPGYGICSGVASEDLVLSDADTVMRFVRDDLAVPVKQVLLFGRSLGGAPAIYLASRYDCYGLVTVAAFSSIRSIAGKWAPWAIWLTNIFDNEERIRWVRCTALILHGDQDALIHVGHARELATAYGSEAGTRGRVVMNVRKGVAHNNFDVKKDVIEPIKMAFPTLNEGEKISLDAAVNRIRYGQPQRLAADVVDRAPFPPNWKPSAPPYAKRRLLDVVDGFTVDI